MFAAAGGGPTYVLNQNFEGPGYDNGETWIPFGTVNPDEATIFKVGSQSFKNTGNGSIYATISDAAIYTLDFWYRIPGAPPSNATIAALRTSDGSAICLARLTNDLKMDIFVSGDDSGTPTTDAMSLNTWYRVRMIWNRSGTCSVEFNETGTFSGDGTDYPSKTAGTATIGRIYIGQGVTSYYDLVQLTE